jgi:hypothetical protein
LGGLRGLVPADRAENRHRNLARRPRVVLHADVLKCRLIQRAVDPGNDRQVVLETSAVIASPKPCLEEGRGRDEPNNRQIRRVNCLPDQPEFLACRDRAGDDT